MGKAVDKQTMLDLIVEAKRTDPETGSFTEWLAEYLVEHLPTREKEHREGAEAILWTLDQLREEEAK